MEMGKEIRRLRTNRGLTQEALAAALNVSPQTVSKWECGSSMPDVQTLPEIAVYFGVTIDQLFAMSPEQQMERIENHIHSSFRLNEAEERQIKQQMYTYADNPKYEARAKILLTKLYNHQSEQYRFLATECGKEAVEKSCGDRDAVSELANAWGSYIPDWNVRNHHALIEWFSDFCRRNPDNRAALMWLLDNLIDDRRLSEAHQWLEKLTEIDSTFRTVMYRYLIAIAAGDNSEAENRLYELEAMEGQEWCWAVTLGDIYTQRQEYDKAIEWYRKGQEIQPSPKYIDSAVSIAHICEIRGDKAGAIASYKVVLNLLKEEWGLISGDGCEKAERAIKRLQL